MQYNWLMIKDLAKIGDLITFAQKEVKKLTLRTGFKEFQIENSAENAIDLAAEISETQAELNATIASIPTFETDSLKQKEAIGKQKRLESQLYDLQMDSETAGEVALLKGQFYQSRTTALLAEANKFLAEAQARKTAIEAGN